MFQVREGKAFLAHFPCTLGDGNEHPGMIRVAGNGGHFFFTFFGSHDPLAVSREPRDYK